MQVFDKDLVPIIAKHICCKSTWHSFTLSCRLASRVAQTLTDCKKDEFGYIHFVSQVSWTDRVDCNWHGRFTKGMVNCRGTRLWFLPRGMNIIHDEDCSFLGLEDFKREVVDPKCDFPGDLCQLRHEQLSELIKGLSGESTEVCMFTTIAYWDLVDMNIYWDLVALLPPAEILLVNMFPTSMIWRLVDLEGVIEELRRVLAMCIEDNVTFDWV